MTAKDDLVTGDLGAHVRRLAIPTSVGFFFMIMFNIVDTVVAGFIDTNAQAGLAFAFPMFFAIIAVSAGIGQASAGMIARARGARQLRRARYYVGQTAAYCVAIGILLSLIGSVVIGPILKLLVGDSPNAQAQYEYALAYTLLIFWAAPMFHLVSMLNGVLAANGNTTTFRNSVIATTLLNIILDPVLAFGWLGLPKLGIAGIALATVIAQAVQIMMLLPATVKLPMMADFRRIFFVPRRIAFAAIPKHSLPPTLHMLSIGIGFMIITYYLARLDDMAVAAYGITIRIEQLLLIHTIGLNQALLAIAGQNFGARQMERVKEAHHIVIRYGIMLSVVSIAIMLGLGNQLIWLFNRDPHIIELGVQYLVVASILSMFYVVAHSCVAMMQAIGKPALIGPLGALRLAVLPMVFCIILVKFLDWGIDGVWTSLVVSNVIVTVILVLIVRFMMRVPEPMALPAR